MKKLLFLLLIILSSKTLFAQDADVRLVDDGLIKPSKGKSMVYIVRRETGALLIKFSLYDGDIFLGKLSAKKYFAYECDPGEHVFIAKGENTFYVDANLEEGKTYVIDLRLQVGILTSRVSLKPIDHSNKKFEKEKKKIIEFVTKKKGELLLEADDDDNIDDDVEDLTVESGSTMSKRLRKFYEMKEKGKKITTITPDMYFD